MNKWWLAAALSAYSVTGLATAVPTSLFDQPDSVDYSFYSKAARRMSEAGKKLFERSQFYLAVDGMKTVPDKFDSDVTHETTAQRNEIEYKTEMDHGWGGQIRGGMRGNYFRLEEAIRYVRNSPDDSVFELTLDAGGTPTKSKTKLNTSGDITSIAAITNLLIEFRNVEKGFIPYIGAGAGVGQVEYDAKVSVASTATGTALLAKNRPGMFFTQGIAGIAYAVNENFHLDLFAAYTHTVEQDSELRINDASSTHLTFSRQYHDKVVGLGAEYFV